MGSRFKNVPFPLQAAAAAAAAADELLCAEEEAAAKQHATTELSKRQKQKQKRKVKQENKKHQPPPDQTPPPAATDDAAASAPATSSSSVNAIISMAEQQAMLAESAALAARWEASEHEATMLDSSRAEVDRRRHARQQHAGSADGEVGFLDDDDDGAEAGRSADATTSAEGTDNAALGNAPTAAEPRRQHPDSSASGEGDGSRGERATSTGAPSSAAAAPRVASCVESTPSPVGPSSDDATAAAVADGALRSSGWQQFVCATSGKPYYRNDATDVTQWDRPTLLEPPARQPPTDALGGEAASGRGGWAASPLPAQEEGSGATSFAAMASPAAPSDENDAPDDDAPGSEVERLRQEVTALKRALAERDQQSLDHEIERNTLSQQCDLLARQNDRLIRQRDDAIAQAEKFERAAAARERSESPAAPPERGADGEAGGKLYHGVHECVDVD